MIQSEAEDHPKRTKDTNHDPKRSGGSSQTDEGHKPRSKAKRRIMQNGRRTQTMIQSKAEDHPNGWGAPRLIPNGHNAVVAIPLTYPSLASLSYRYQLEI